MRISSPCTFLLSNYNKNQAGDIDFLLKYGIIITIYTVYLVIK